MWKLCATITAIGGTVLSSLVQAQGITGIYSCSSGVNNDRPVTYMFNSDLMVRDGAQSAPFEFVTGLNGGKLLYLGIRPTQAYDPDLWCYGIKSSDLERWLPKERERLEVMLGTGQIDETNEDYLLVNAVSCLSVLSQEDDTAKYLRQRAATILPRGDRGEYVPLDQRCDMLVGKLKTMGITDPEAELLRRNYARAPKNEVTDTVMVTVDLTTSQVFEAILDNSMTTHVYNCTVLDIDVPKIDPPESAVKAST